MNPASFQIRRFAQRFRRDLPRGHAPFAEVFPESAPDRPGILHQRHPRFTGVLREESGEPFVLAPTRYADGSPGTLADEDRICVTSEPARRLYAAAGAAVYGPHGIVYDPGSRRVVRESLESWDANLDHHPVFSTPRYPPAAPLGGVSLLLATLGGQTFYHFFIEALPKLALLGDLARHVDHVLVSRHYEESKSRWLELLGLSDRIVWLQEDGHYRCEHLLFTNRLVRHFEPNPWGVKALRGLFPPGRSAPGQSGLLWLDRSRNPTRPVAWEQELAARIPGATPVEMGQLPPRDCIDRCAGANALAGFHGAAFANMVFCPPDTKIAEIMPRPFHPWYARLAQVCGHRHLAVRAAEEPSSQGAAADAINTFLASP